MEEEKNYDKEWNQKLIVIVVLIILVAIIVVYVFSFGKLNYLKEDKDKKRLKWIDNRLADLHYQYKTKEELRAQLDLRVKRAFFWARVSMVSIFLIINFIGFYYNTTQNLNDRLCLFLNYNQVFFFLLIATLFIIFETSAEIKDVMKIIHLEIKKYVYKDNTGLEKEVAEITAEIKRLTDEKNKIQEQGASNESKDL